MGKYVFINWDKKLEYYNEKHNALFSDPQELVFHLYDKYKNVVKTAAVLQTSRHHVSHFLKKHGVDTSRGALKDNQQIEAKINLKKKEYYVCTEREQSTTIDVFIKELFDRFTTKNKVCKLLGISFRSLEKMIDKYSINVYDTPEERRRKRFKDITDGFNAKNNTNYSGLFAVVKSLAKQYKNRGIISIKLNIEKEELTKILYHYRVGLKDLIFDSYNIVKIDNSNRNKGNYIEHSDYKPDFEYTDFKRSPCYKCHNRRLPKTNKNCRNCLYKKQYCDNLEDRTFFYN